MYTLPVSSSMLNRWSASVNEAPPFDAVILRLEIGEFIYIVSVVKFQNFSKSYN